VDRSSLSEHALWTWGREKREYGCAERIPILI
jgi:hypothetical protein